MHENEAAQRFDHGTHLLANRIVGSDGGADRDPAVLGDFRRHVANATDVDVAVLLAEAEFGRQMFAD